MEKISKFSQSRHNFPPNRDRIHTSPLAPDRSTPTSIRSRGGPIHYRENVHLRTVLGEFVTRLRVIYHRQRRCSWRTRTRGERGGRERRRSCTWNYTTTRRNRTPPTGTRIEDLKAPPASSFINHYRFMEVLMPGSRQQRPRRPCKWQRSVTLPRFKGGVAFVDAIIVALTGRFFLGKSCCAPGARPAKQRPTLEGRRGRSSDTGR